MNEGVQTRPDTWRQLLSQDALTTDAPAADDTAATSVEDMAPESQTEAVEGGSAPSEQLIPVSRFNGLMGKFNQTQNELARTRQELEDLRNAGSEETKPVADTSALEQQVAALTEMLLEERKESAKRAVFDEYPEAKLFEDLLVGDSPDDIRETAKLIAERIRSQGQAAEDTQEPTPQQAPAAEAGATETPAVPAAPVTGGGSTFVGDAAAEDKVADAIKRRDFSGWLRAKRESDASWQGETEVLSA